MKRKENDDEEEEKEEEVPYSNFLDKRVRISVFGCEGMPILLSLGDPPAL